MTARCIIRTYCSTMQLPTIRDIMVPGLCRASNPPKPICAFKSASVGSPRRRVSRQGWARSCGKDGRGMSFNFASLYAAAELEGAFVRTSRLIFPTPVHTCLSSVAISNDRFCFALSGTRLIPESHCSMLYIQRYGVAPADGINRNAAPLLDRILRDAPHHRYSGRTRSALATEYS